MSRLYKYSRFVFGSNLIDHQNRTSHGKSKRVLLTTGIEMLNIINAPTYYMKRYSDKIISENNTYTYTKILFENLKRFLPSSQRNTHSILSTFKICLGIKVF